MFEFIQAGGWLMIPIMISSIIASAIIIDRLLVLRRDKVLPLSDIEQAQQLAKSGRIANGALQELAQSSVIGSVLAVGLRHYQAPRHFMKESIEEAGRQATRQLERYLNGLGTVSAITPLLGLLGTVLGMISAFARITEVGVGDPTAVAGGISQALFTTAAGIGVAVFALVFLRYFKGRVDYYVSSMEQEAMHLVDLCIAHRNQINVSDVKHHSAPVTENPVPHGNAAKKTKKVPAVQLAQSQKTAKERAAERAMGHVKRVRRQKSREEGIS